eukprot:405514-Pleurochrysis_carterae.AAC.1
MITYGGTKYKKGKLGAARRYTGKTTRTRTESVTYKRVCCGLDICNQETHANQLGGILRLLCLVRKCKTICKVAIANVQFGK